MRIESVLKYLAKDDDMEVMAIFPINGKKPLTKHGYKDASKDPAQIEAWWNRWPNANIGLPTGETNGILVIDVDILSAGDIDTLMEHIRMELLVMEKINIYTVGNSTET